MSFLGKFMLALLVVCALIAPPSAGLTSSAHAVVAVQPASHTLKVCDNPNLCI